MLAFIALFFPAAIMVIWKKRLFEENYDWKAMLMEYIAGVVLINFLVIAIVYLFFGNENGVVSSINAYNGFALKYMVLAITLAILAPLFYQKIQKNIVDGNLCRGGISFQNCPHFLRKSSDKYESGEREKKDELHKILQAYGGWAGKWALNAVVSIVLSAFIGVLLLILVMQIPQGSLYENAKEAAALLYEEGTYPNIFEGTTGSRLDNFTDGLMINIAYTTTDDWLDDALLPSLILYSDPDADESINPMSAFYKYIYGDDGSSYIETYGRYWHGYLVYLRPLLTVMSYSSIRSMNMVIQLTCMFLLIYLLTVEQKKQLIIPAAAVYICMCPPATWNSLQYSPVFYVTIVSCIFILLRHEKSNSFGYCRIFLMNGIVIAFLDLLTAPLVTLGIPLITFFAVDFSKIESVMKRVRQLVMFSISWVAGYGGMWASKWIIATLFTDQNIITNAILQMKQKTSHSSEWEDYTWSSVIKSNFSMLKSPTVLTVLILSVSIFILFMLMYRMNHTNPGNSLGQLIVCCFPFAWYLVLMNHSGVHYWMTYRELGIAIYGIFSLFFCQIDFERKRFSKFFNKTVSSRQGEMNTYIK